MLENAIVNSDDLPIDGSIGNVLHSPLAMQDWNIDKAGRVLCLLAFAFGRASEAMKTSLVMGLHLTNVTLADKHV